MSVVFLPPKSMQPYNQKKETNVTSDTKLLDDFWHNFVFLKHALWWESTLPYLRYRKWHFIHPKLSSLTYSHQVCKVLQASAKENLQWRTTAVQNGIFSEKHCTAADSKTILTIWWQTANLNGPLLQIIQFTSTTDTTCCLCSLCKVVYCRSRKLLTAKIKPTNY